MAIRTFRNYWRPSHYHRFDEEHYNSIFRKKNKKNKDIQEKKVNEDNNHS